jgi:DNA-binding ferritin-like protein (Dps family)
MKSIEYIIEQALSRIIAEAPAKETDNAPSDSVESPFTPAEEKFLGKFDAYGTTHLGIIYSLSDIGIREFVGRSGAELNISPGILLSLLRNKTIKLVPYTGFGRNTDYTLELQLSLDDVAGLGDEDKKEIEAGAAGGGAAGPVGGPAEELPPPPGPEVAWVIPYGQLIKESTLIAKQLITEKTANKKKSSAKVHVDKSRVLKRLPKSYINQLERIIDMMGKRAHTSHEKQRIIADILDNLAINLDLTDKQIKKSYEFFKNQKRLQESFEAEDEPEFIYESVLPALHEATSPQRLSLENQGLSKYILNAGSFWSKLPGVFSGWGLDWDETLFFSVLRKYLWNASVADKRKQAIVIDAVGIILGKFNGAALKDISYGQFLMDWINGHDLIEYPITAPSMRGDIRMIGDIFSNAQLKAGILDEVDDTKKLVNGLDFNNIGKLKIELANGTQAWFPTYTNTDVYTMVGTLLAPYRAKIVKDTADHDKLKPTKADRLSREQKIYMAKAVIPKINNVKRISQGATEKGARLDITSWPEYGGAWVDSDAKPFVWINQPANDMIPKHVVRLYSNGISKSIMPNTKLDGSKIPERGTVFHTAKYWFDWDSAKRRYVLKIA